jgi:hypothetical protein
MPCSIAPVASLIRFRLIFTLRSFGIAFISPVPYSIAFVATFIRLILMCKISSYSLEYFWSVTFFIDFEVSIACIIILCYSFCIAILSYMSLSVASKTFVLLIVFSSSKAIRSLSIFWLTWTIFWAIIRVWIFPIIVSWVKTYFIIVRALVCIMSRLTTPVTYNYKISLNFALLHCVSSVTTAIANERVVSRKPIVIDLNWTLVL